MSRIIFVILCFKLCSAFVLESFEDVDTLRLPTEYHFKGDVTSLDYGMIKPFEIWYSAENNKSRMDTYGGMVKRYYYGDDEELYYVHPQVSEELVNTIVCTRTSNEGEQQNFLPSKKKFKPAGQTTYNNKLVNVWNYSLYFGQELKTEAKIFVYRENGVDIPVLYQKKELNLWNGVLNSHTITRYYDFQAPKVEDLVYEDENDCDWDKSDDLMSKLKHLEAHIPSDVEEAFKRYKDHHNKEYDDDEREMRKLIFKENWRRITEHNNKNLSYKMGINKFSDRSPSELVHLTGTRPAPRQLGSEPFPFTVEQLEEMADGLPENYDMRMDGIISSVKNQGDCGSCWTFSTVAAVEGALAKRNGGRDLDLSEQSLVDCAWSYNNEGCDGGFLPYAFKYVLKYGIPTEKEYGSYLGEDGSCHIKNLTDIYKIKGFALIPPLSVTAMKAALYHFGPVTVTINAMDNLKYYFSGIYYDAECNDDHINHAVTVVGYGVRDNSPYWIVKNSWGEDWGQDGYILFSAENNNCHILEGAYYAIV